MIISIDYDDTIVDADYPNSGAIKPFAKEVINRLYDQGHYILIWTCRANDRLDVAKSYLDECGVKYHTINENLPHIIEQYNGDTRKQSADVYIDDKSLMGIPTWLEIYNILQHKFNKY